MVQHDSEVEADPKKISFIMTKAEKEELIAEEKRKRRNRAKNVKPQIH
jgi:hypothetical protein